jgi:voltage-gated potassium channel Kch
MVFAVEYLHRLIVEHPDFGSKLRMISSLRNIADLLSFLPPLGEAALQLFMPAFSLGRLDLRWVKLLRSMRVMRVGLLGAELRSLHLSTKRGGWLTAGANFRLVQLATSVLMLLFVASAIIQVVEQMPFHKAMYLVATTLSTVGYGDVVATSLLGRAAILAMIALGIVLIPVQAAAFYSEVNARRVVRGSLPDWRGKPFVLLSARLTEVRAFSDFFAEYQQALGSSSRFPRMTKLIALCNRPSFEFSAFQELHERQVTLVEGSAVSGQDLVTVRAERAQAVLLIANRFTTDPESEDLNILFQVWACKSYTKTVPLFVQTLRQSTVRQVAPFLDPEQDVIVSAEQTRFRMLALSASCPGASTLIGNLMRSSAVLPLEAQGPTLAGRRWMRQYVNGTAYSFVTAAVQRHLAGKEFADVAEWLYRTAGFVVAGVIENGGRVRLNPGREVLRMGTQLLVIGTDKRNVRLKLAEEYVPLDEVLKERARNRARKAQASTTSAISAATTTDTTTTTTTTVYGTDSHDSIDQSNEMCVPIIWGNVESDSMDFDNLPCVPSQVASDLKNEKDVEAFMYKFERNEGAKLEQEEFGELEEGTARAVAEEAGIYTNKDKTSRGSPSTPSPPTPAYFSSEADSSASLLSKTLSPSTTALSSSSLSFPSQFKNHFILCGHGGSVVPFMSYLRTAEPSRSSPIVILAPTPPQDFEEAKRKFGPVIFVSGSPSEASSLRAAGAATAKALVYLARGSRPVKTAQATGAAVEQERSTREAVLADASALLACYGVGEESGASLTHAVVELLFTTSIEFLQPGLLLKGINSLIERVDGPSEVNAPRKSFTMRAWQQREAVAEGLAEWQANAFYAAGRVTVPALMDTFATQCFFSKGLLVEVLAEMSGDLNREAGGVVREEELEEDKEKEIKSGEDEEESSSSGALLQLVPLPASFAGKTYGELFMSFIVAKSTLVSLGLYRIKSENPGTKLCYVVSNPPPWERLELTDRVFVLVERPR